jgi:hypothetical protein
VVHRAIAGGVDDEIGRQLGVVGQCHALGVDALNVDAALELDAAVGHQFAGAHVDVVARTTPQVLHEQTRTVVAEIEHETRLLQSAIEIGLALLHLVVHRNLEGVHDFVRHAGKQQIALVVIDAVLDGLFAVQPAQGQL